MDAFDYMQQCNTLSKEKVWSKVLVDELSALEVARVMSSVVAGKNNGVGTGTVSFRDINDTKDRIIATIDGANNRSDIVVDGS